ncbi:MAG: GNAT family N-acetyltransferase [Bacteroidota bacterium]
MEYKSFETERLIIRPTAQEDADFLFELMNTPKWLQFIGDRNITSLEKAKEYIKVKMTPQLVRLGYSSYTVITKEGGVKVGNCGLYDREGLEGIDIGFAFLPAHEKKGYAYEASNRIKEAAFEDFGIETICAITAKGNVSSQRLLEKLGLRQHGTTVLPNETEELLLFKIDRKPEGGKQT